MISTIAPSFANTVAPFVPITRAPISQETKELKSSTFRPTEQAAESGRGLNRRFPDERPNDDVERERVERGAQNLASDDQAAREAAVKRRAEQDWQQDERDQIQELSTRDREVRNHEQAHAAVAGQYGSSPTYSFVRGPDGVSYAVSGEVKIDTSPISGDPEATLRKAQQLRRAANAPAEPSAQDSNVAAQATQMEQQARVELREQRSIDSSRAADDPEKGNDSRSNDVDLGGSEQSEFHLAVEQQLTEEETRLQAEEEHFDAEQRMLDQRQARAELFSESAKRNIDINRRLIEMGVRNSGVGIGDFLNRRI